MLVRELQQWLGRLYAIELSADVSDYLVTDARVPAQLLGTDEPLSDEMLLVQECPGSVDLTLYLNAALLDRLDYADPRYRLVHGNLDDFCRVLEGVSHFVYLAWKACNDRRVSMLELEVQAEVDKYLGARLLLESQGGAVMQGPELLQRLFAQVRYRDSLSTEEQARYRCANDVASRYCRNLEQRFTAGPVPAAMMQELRAFYRMPQPDKLSHINSSQFA